MHKSLEIIAKEFNPKYDFDWVDFDNYSIEDTTLFLWGTPKPILRSALVGGILGTGISVISGNSPAYGLQHGAILGAELDFLQYFLRGFYYDVRYRGTPIIKKAQKTFKEVLHEILDYYKNRN